MDIRIIPLLLLHKKGLYKTVKFKNPRYIGDPVNAVKIFNEKEVDEIIIFDIDASVKKRSPDIDFIQKVASECFIPLCYGGGVKSIEEMKKIFHVGVEKISLSYSSFSCPKLIENAADTFGSQSVIVTIDYRKSILGKRNVFTLNGKKDIKLNVEEALKIAEDSGAGEIVFNSIDNEGSMRGLDINFLEKICCKTKLPIIATGGVGNISHIKELFEKTTIKAVACGSMVVYKGVLNGVLINYPKEKDIYCLNNV